jgi:hypothetical protein
MARDVPWAGVVALLLMFILPAVPAWLFEGPRTIKHRPTRHVCGDCGRRWTEGHSCRFDVDDDLDRPVVRAELQRLDQPRKLVLRQGYGLRRGRHQARRQRR